MKERHLIGLIRKKPGLLRDTNHARFGEIVSF